MKTSVIAIVIAAILGAVVSIGIMYGLTRDKGDKTDVRVAVDDIKEIARLATVEYHMSTVYDKELALHFLEWIPNRLLILLTGVVQGSVDLNLADIQLPAADAKTVSIKFKKGAVVISNPSIGPKDIKVMTLSNVNVFHPISDDDRNKAQDEAIKLLKKSAMDAGIVAKTANEAKILLTRFLGGLGYTATIEFEGISLQ